MDGRIVAVAYSDGRIGIWDGETKALHVMFAIISG